MRLKFNSWMRPFKRGGRAIITPITSPFGLAVSFAMLAIATCVASAFLEGRLTTPERAILPDGTSVSIIPFGWNISTLVDFALLDPFVIYFLQRSRVQQRLVDAGLTGDAYDLKLHTIAVRRAIAQVLAP